MELTNYNSKSNLIVFHPNIIQSQINSSTIIHQNDKNSTIMLLSTSNDDNMVPILTELSSPDGGQYHPRQWAERAHSIRLSSPDRIATHVSSEDLASSPIRPSSSPILFSPPPPQQQQQHQSEDRQSYVTPTKTSTTQNLKRGRPRNEDISNLILSGSNSLSSIKCNICHRVFPREKSLQAHLRTHTGQRPYRCDYDGCGRAFAQSGQLRTHQRLHTGEKPFICQHQDCQKRFTHPNRRCSLHPLSGVRRIIPIQTNTSVKKTIKKSEDSKDDTKSQSSITLLSSNDDQNVRGPVIIARKSVINHTGKSNISRKLDAELSAVEISNQEINININNDENNPELLGALALMELAKGGVGKESIDSKSTKRILQSIQIN